MWEPNRRFVRYSALFRVFHSCLAYSSQEEMLDNALAYLRVSHVAGDYLEFGVYQGQTLAAAFHLAKSRGFQSMQFYAFDSFAGLPSPSGVDAEGYRQFDEGQYQCDEPTFKANLRRQGVDLNRVTIVPGWFKDSLTDAARTALPLTRAALIWIDCDLYESAVPVLNFVTDYVQDGAVIVFDDWFAFRSRPERGEQRAFSEWLESTPFVSAVQFLRMGWHGNSFVVHRNDTTAG